MKYPSSNKNFDRTFTEQPALRSLFCCCWKLIVLKLDRNYQLLRGWNWGFFRKKVNLSLLQRAFFLSDITHCSLFCQVRERSQKASWESVTCPVSRVPCPMSRVPYPVSRVPCPAVGTDEAGPLALGRCVAVICDVAHLYACLRVQV